MFASQAAWQCPAKAPHLHVPHGEGQVEWRQAGGLLVLLRLLLLLHVGERGGRRRRHAL